MASRATPVGERSRLPIWEKDESCLQPSPRTTSREHFRLLAPSIGVVAGVTRNVAGRRQETARCPAYRKNWPTTGPGDLPAGGRRKGRTAARGRRGSFHRGPVPARPRDRCATGQAGVGFGQPCHTTAPHRWRFAGRRYARRWELWPQRARFGRGFAALSGNGSAFSPTDMVRGFEAGYTELGTWVDEP